MALIPFEIPFADNLCGPCRSKHLIPDPEDYVQAFIPSGLLASPLGDLNNIRNVLPGTGASINSDKDKFQASVDVQQFTPEEISVKVTDNNTVTIEGKHEDMQDEHGYISRHFVRRYVLPENCDVNQIQSKLSSDGVLTITAPKVEEDKKIKYREIPIFPTGQPMKRIEQKEKPKK